MGEHDDQTLALARIEVKLDTLIAANSDHEGRLRKIELAGYVTGRQLWASVVGSATVASALVAAAALLVHK